MILNNIRKRLKVFSVLSSLALLIPTRTDVNACAYGPDYEELRYMLLNPDLLENKSWWSFFYSNKFEYLDGTAFSDADEIQLVSEWKQLTNTHAADEVIKDCVFGSLPDSLLTQNEFYQDISKQPAIQAYFETAKQCEQVATLPSPWDDNETLEAERQAGRVELISQIQKKIQQEKQGVLKTKYAFQLLKLAYYADNTPAFNETFNTYFKSAKPSVLYWWALNYKSMMLEHEGKADSANYLHARIYANSSQKMLVSKRSFSTNNLAGTLSLAQTKEDSADVFVLAAVINPGKALEGLNKIYQLNPNHKHLPMLIGREINKLEDWLGSTQFAESEIVSSYEESDGGASRQQHDLNYLQELTESLEQMTALAQSYPDVYHLWLADLYLMSNNASGAATHLKQIQSKNHQVDFQKKVFDLILTTQAEDIKKDETQEKIGKQFEELLNERYQKFESQKVLYSLSSYLRHTFANKDLIHLAGLFDYFAKNKFCYYCSGSTFEYAMIAYFDQYTSTTELEKLIALYTATDKNTLEKILLKPYSSQYYFTDLLGTLYVRKGDLKKAQQVFKSIPDDFWFTFENASYNLDSDPFNNNQELLGVQGMATYNKREIVDKLISLEEEALRDPGKAEKNYFLLANAWYNFTQHSWFMINYGYSAYSSYSAAETQARMRAISYYKKALTLTGNPELKAKISYMLALLANENEKYQYARTYEMFADTQFYQQKNCITLRELVQ